MSMHLLKKLKLDVEKKVEIETITNSNGTAKKFNDGTMFCYSQENLTVSINQPWGSLYVSSPIVPKAFPVAFLETPMIFFGAQTNYLSAVSIFLENGATKTTPNSIVFARGEKSEGTELFLNVCAIGRWK